MGFWMTGLLGAHVAGQRVAGDAGVATGVECAAGAGAGNGIRISGKGSWSLRMSCNRLIYGNIFGAFEVLQKTLAFQHGLWQSTLS